MKRPSACLLVLAVFGAFAPAHAAGAGAQEQGAGSVLLGADLELTLESPRVATVRAEFEIQAPDTITVLIALLPGQRLSTLEFSGARGPLTAEPRERSSALRAWAVQLPPDTTALSVRYRIDNDAAAAHRFALPVPEATPTAGGQPVRLTVELPDAAGFGGNAFPPLRLQADGRWRASSVAVPSLAHVVTGASLVRRNIHHVIEWTAIGLLLLAGFGARAWSRRAAAGRSSV